MNQALSGMKRAGFMSVACIIIITCSLLIFGIFLVATANLREVLKFAHGKVEIVAFLDGEVSQAGVDSLMTEIGSIPFIKDMRYVDPETALGRLREEFGSRSHILDAMDKNPLPASLEITLKPQYRLRDRVIGVAERIEKLRGVEDISYGRGWITILEKIVRVFAIVDIVVGLIVGIAAVVTVSYTVRLTVFARKEMIRLLKLVGATDYFIMAPFLIEGVIHGAISVCLSFLVLYVGYRAVGVKVPQAAFMPWEMVVFFAVFGVAVAAVGSWVSVRSFLEEKSEN
ncbi:MAG: permease-like cell division protein FtsX [Candidatus Eisenbacteria bacterium]